MKTPPPIFYSHISAAAKNHTIGFRGKLPWHIPEDLKFFYQKTRGRALIMGRKTFESLGRLLPNRLHVVVTRQKDFFSQRSKAFQLNQILYNQDLGDPGGLQAAMFYGAEPAIEKALSLVVCTSLEEAYAFCARPEVWQKHGKEIFITGGGEIYQQSLPLVQKIYLTRIHKDYKGDAFYPEIPKDQFEQTHRIDKDGPPPYSFITLERRT